MSNTTSPIPNREENLFSWIKENFISDLVKSASKYASSDCFSTEFNLDIELKCRRTHYSTLILEKKKYDALIDRAEQYGTKPVYINSTPKGIWGFYISDIVLDWQKKMLPRNTDFGDREKIEKEISYLDISKGENLWEINFS